ncbi:hypothetical protein [Buchananella felis]|uniref:hypothetical protein n=1 Tax=Buchananella felis TaxID=3231492 RepID=UPI003528C92F
MGVKVINASIPEADMALLKKAAAKLKRAEVEAHPLARYGYSGARIYVIKTPSFGKKAHLPHVVKIATPEEIEREIEGHRIAQNNIRNVKPGYEVRKNGSVAIFFQLVSDSDGKVVDAADVYEKCMRNEVDAKSTLLPLLGQSLDLLQTAHIVIKGQGGFYGDYLEEYTRPRRKSRASRMFECGELEYGGTVVAKNPVLVLPELIVEEVGEFVTEVNHGDFHLSNIVVDRNATNPCLIDFAWTKSGGHGLIDYAMLESSLRFMKFPTDVNPRLLLEIDQRLTRTLSVADARARINEIGDCDTRARLTAMIDSVAVVREKMIDAFDEASNHSLWLEYNRVMFLVLAGQEKFESFPLERTIVNLDYLRKQIGM